MIEAKLFRSHRFVTGLLVFSLLGIIFWLGYTMTTATETSSSKKWISNHPLLSKRLSVEDQNDILINFAPLREAVKFYFSNIKADYSFYFEYLPTGTSIQAGENTELVSASLVKVPLVMDLYKSIELKKPTLIKPLLLKRKI